jgi:excisionase family DNA binding protein
MNDIYSEFKKLRKTVKNIISVNNKEWYSLMKNEIRNSIAIEGIFADRNDLIKVLEKNKKTKGQVSAAILGYFEAASFSYEYANNLYNQNEFSLRLSDIKQIHSLLMRYEKKEGYYKGELGNFRKENVEVFNSTFTPLNYIFLNDVMNTYVKWINNNLKLKNTEIIKFIAKSHLLFETIHPFRDGNGRVGRILLCYLLIGAGYINIAIKGVRKKEREIYYNIMEKEDNMFEDMLRLFEKGEKSNLRTFEKFSRMTDSSSLEKLINASLSESFLQFQNKRTYEYRPETYIPLLEASALYNYSSDYLRNLINKGKLPAIRKGKKWYIKISDLESYIKKIERKYLTL